MLLKRILLKDFRNYGYKEFQISKSIIVAAGQNGSGKTNLLESISLLENPKGLRSCLSEDMINHESAQKEWVTFFGFDDGTSLAFQFVENKKLIKIDGKTVRSQQKIHDFIKILWICPQNDRIFSESPEKRKKFFDTIVGIFEPEFKTIKNKYQHYIFERTKLLYQNGDPKWLQIVEDKIAENSVLYIQKRQKALASLNEYLKNIQHLKSCFFKTKEGIDDVWLEGGNEEHLKNGMLQRLKESRAKDMKHGGCSEGPHKTDYEGYFTKENINLKFASNGQQCLAQIEIFLGTIFYLLENKNVIFLIDEVFMHLDKENRALLLKELDGIIKDNLNFQTWIAVTDSKAVEYEECQKIEL